MAKKHKQGQEETETTETTEATAETAPGRLAPPDPEYVAKRIAAQDARKAKAAGK